MKENKMLGWPAIIKHSGDAELTYIADQTQWDNDDDLHSLDYTENDLLIDSTGTVFMLTCRVNGAVVPEPKGHSMSLTDMLGLVKAHAAQQGSCCVAKLYAPTIRDALTMVSRLNDQW